MPGRNKRGGQGGGAGEQIEILRGIWNSIKDLGKNLGGRIDKTNARLDETNSRLDETNSRLDAMKEEITELRDETRRGFERLDRRMDNFLTGEHGRDHSDLRDRVTRLEERVGIQRSS